MLDKLQHEFFSQLVGQVFEVKLPDGAAVPLVLASVNSHGRPQLPGGRSPFSLLFLGPQSRLYLQQGTYHLENSALEGLDIFLVPLGPVSGHPQPGGAPQVRMQYEAVFN